MNNRLKRSKEYSGTQIASPNQDVEAFVEMESQKSKASQSNDGKIRVGRQSRCPSMSVSYDGNQRRPLGDNGMRDLKNILKKSIERSELLYEDGKARSKRLNWLHKKMNFNCTHIPRINKKSCVIVRDKIFKEKKLNIEEHTDTIEGRNYLPNNKNLTEVDLNGSDFRHFLEKPFQDRSAHYTSLKVEKLEMANRAKRFIENYHLQTGKPLYRPN